MASLRSRGATHTYFFLSRTVGGLDQALFIIDELHLQILIEDVREPRQEVSHRIIPLRVIGGGAREGRGEGGRRRAQEDSRSMLKCERLMQPPNFPRTIRAALGWDQMPARCQKVELRLALFLFGSSGLHPIATLSLLWANSPYTVLEHRPMARLRLELMNSRGLISPTNQPSRSRRSARSSGAFVLYCYCILRLALISFLEFKLRPEGGGGYLPVSPLSWLVGLQPSHPVIQLLNSPWC
ncbi:hypothetical protein BO83DRAFT_2087 [Aspergillus eucalypticola CBS 122712]|uniref:Uncharacterized protein n=1 Tax=Aspergillus eucalypticola (strain CBS 122712 / IBT 29274) TaxID=1448314 RepID=A0A317WJ53_ASPEC|nr:uncharacterized protein BO83DRAFT_2087 [Aspergillus eucalypticola CBS 122712]PWY85207.1 hypothetical protein BO83DRAFT_2087 [Aspergillus eucalypticola CBS 122712]